MAFNLWEFCKLFTVKKNESQRHYRLQNTHFWRLSKFNYYASIIFSTLTPDEL